MVKQIKKLITTMLLSLALAVIAEVLLINPSKPVSKPETVYWEQVIHHSDRNYLLNLARPRFDVQPDKSTGTWIIIEDERFYGDPEVVKFPF